MGYFNAYYHLKSKDMREVIQYMVGEVMTVQTSYSSNNLQVAYLFKNFSCNPIASSLQSLLFCAHIALASLVAISGPKKVLDFQGPPLPLALLMDIARLKIIPYRAI